MSRRRNGNHMWTIDEREIIRRDYRGTNKSADGIASRLGVTFNAVKGQIQKMGISFHREDRKPWKPSEEKYLINNIHSLPVEIISKKIKRGISSVILKSKRLHLKRRERDGWYTKREVCEILGIDHHKAQIYIDCGALKASYHNGHRPGKNGMAMWHINERDLRNFIIAYSSEFVGRNVDLFQIIALLAGNKMEARR